MSKVFESIRQEIDSVDRKLLDLLVKRSELVQKVAVEKKKNKAQIIQPHREALLMRRLLERETGQFPKESIVRIWREIIGAASLLQTDVKVAVATPDGQEGFMYWDIAKDYFNSVIPMQRAANALSALGMVREGEVMFGVVPWPEDNVKNPWWHFLMDDAGSGGVQIVARLPFGDQSNDAPNLEFRSVVLGRMNFEPSGNDRSFLALEMQDNISRGRIVEKAEACNISVCSIYVPDSDDTLRKVYLLEVEGYHQGEGDSLQSLVTALGGADTARCVSLGGYPSPPSYNDVVGKNA